jgi:hypothetical protein
MRQTVACRSGRPRHRKGGKKIGKSDRGGPRLREPGLPASAISPASAVGGSVPLHFRGPARLRGFRLGRRSKPPGTLSRLRRHSLAPYFPARNTRRHKTRPTVLDVRDHDDTPLQAAITSQLHSPWQRGLAPPRPDSHHTHTASVTARSRTRPSAPGPSCWQS